MNFLLEIGTEEIPHWMIPGALKQLAELNLLGAKPRVDATPRRLVVQAENVPERTPDEQQIVKGPPLSAGDKAAAGFAKKQGVDLSALVQAGEYYELRRLAPGRRTLDILSETIPAAILAIQWPKAMYWTTKTGPRFIRPIRWLVALLDDQVIPFEIAGVKSGNFTYGHRQLGSPRIRVNVANYESELRRNFVILSSHERRHKIEREAAKLEAKIDADLLETLTFITEYPTAIRGSFERAYLGLPAEVLSTVMKNHQKYFSVETAPGKLAPYFVAVMNTESDTDGFVKRGNERVLRARFNDARFFWDVDQKKKLADRVEDLKKVTFHVKLGSYFEKTERVVRLVKELGGNEHAERAALLCKADLTTDMVKEFTELQGVVGGLYARAQGEPEAVAVAIYEHYQPASMEDSIPETPEGQIVSLADKLDTLRECFRIGMVPTGSKDPFALRRAAQGVVKILAEAKLDCRLSIFGTSPELMTFVLDRVQYYFREICHFKYDEVNAVLSAEIPIELESLPGIAERLGAVAQVRSTEDFVALATSFKRINNILRQAEASSHVTLDPALLLEGAERGLFDALLKVWQETREASFLDALRLTASLRPAVDAFFDTVLVNDPDETTRANRLALLRTLKRKFSTIADFSEIVTSGEQK